MKISLPIFGIFLYCLMVGCKTPPPKSALAADDQIAKPYVLKYDRGPCFGQCPVYTFYVMSDHTALLHVKAHMPDAAGWYFSKPDQESIVEILDLMEPMEFWRQDIFGQPEIADLPSVSLVYAHTAGVRDLSLRGRTTQSLEAVFGKLNDIVTRCHWEATSMRPMELSIPEPTDLIVRLQEGTDPVAWMKKYDRYGIQLKRRLAPGQAYFLFTRDPAKENANDFLQYIRNDPDVLGAEWDKQMEIRN